MVDLVSRASRRSFIRVVGMGSLGLLVAACGAPAPTSSTAATPAPASPAGTVAPTVAPTVASGASTPAPASTGAVQLKIGGWFDKGTQQTVAKQLELFQQKFPNATVSIVQIEFDVGKNVVMMASGAAPDVFWVNNDQTAPWASRNALYALDDYVKRDKINLDDMFEVGKLLYSFNGKIYGLTEYLGPLMIFYNPKLFEAAGVPVPPSDYKDSAWTLDALVEKAKALTKRPSSGPVEQYGFYVSTDIYRWLPMLWDHGGDFTDNPEKPTKITFDSPATRQAAQWVADLRLKHQVAATAVEIQSMPFETQFQTGRLAMLCEGPWEWPLFMSPSVHDKVPWEVAPMPKGPAGVFTRMAGDAYGMSAQTKNPDLAWELLKFNTIGEGQTVNWTPALAKGIPSLKSMAEDPKFGNWFAEPSRKAVKDLPVYARIMPKHPNWAEVISKVNPEFDQVWIGKLSADEAVKSAQAKMEQAFARTSQ